MNNILVIGVGAHAKRIYIPILQREQKSGLVGDVIGLDLREKETDIEVYKQEQQLPQLEMFYLDSRLVAYDSLLPDTASWLDTIILDKRIAGVIISTEPLSHMAYAKWALSRGINILIDKPISTRRHISTCQQQAEGLLVDYHELVQLYEVAKRIHPGLVCNVMAQRRYHPAFVRIKELIAEITNVTKCPVTSIQSFHSDGQWRLPSEIIDIDYHSYNAGYGKCSHSGYHSLDVIPWLLEAGETEDKRIDNIDIFTNFLRPRDFIEQINFEDYRGLFYDFDYYNRYNYEEFVEKTFSYGEIDAFTTFAFKKGDHVLTLGSANLVHNGFSQRGWPSTIGKDLYKGNGRVRHESHIIEQGPFQAIHYQSYQSEEISMDETNHYEMGGEYHLDIHVFRNSKLFPQWKSYEKIAIKDLDMKVLEGYSRGHQEDARRYSILEFLHCLCGKVSRPQLISDLTDHKRGCTLMAGIYISAVKRLSRDNPLVTMDFQKYP